MYRYRPLSAGLALAVLLLCLQSIFVPNDANAASGNQLNLVIRDFTTKAPNTHPDFETYNSGLKTGILSPTLGADKKPIYVGGTNSGTVTSSSTFNSWFNDDPRFNKTTTDTLILADDSTPGIYKFDSPSYFPIDGLLWGNENNDGYGVSRNFHFTIEAHSKFIYRPGDTLTLISDDDAWIFINNKLAIDLGGVHGLLTGTIDLNATNAATLGLIPGQVYDFDLFRAERHTSASSLKITTNIEFFDALPETTLAEPTITASSASATFSFSGTGNSFECSLDSAIYGACPSPKSYSSLSDGNHTFSVRSILYNGVADPTPATYTWTVDTTAPDTTILTGPSSPTVSSSATFGFSSNENGVSYECSLDGAAYKACNNPETFIGLSDGSHTLSVRARDSAGNVDPTPATYAWTVDLPDTTIVTGPDSLTNSVNAAFSFTSNKNGGTYECNLDGTAFLPCSSPLTLNNLAYGDHVLLVRAIDAFGNVDATPASYTWKITSVQAVGLQFSNTTYSVVKGNTQSTKLTVTNSDQTTSDVTDKAIYSIADSSIATIDTKGIFTGLNVGDTVLTATYGGLTTNTTLRINSNQSGSPSGSGGSISPAPQPESFNFEVLSSDGSTTKVSITLDEVKKGFVVLKTDKPDMKVIIPASIMERIRSINPNTLLTFQSSLGSITLPIAELNVTALSERQGMDRSKVQMTVSIANTDKDNLGKLEESLKKKQARILVTPVEFHVRIGDGSEKTAELDNFEHYVARTIDMGIVAASPTASGIWWNPDSGEYRFVPSHFEKKDGHTVAELRRQGLSTYAVIDRQVTFPDLSKHWSKESAERLAAKGIVEGRGNGNFDPESTITRAEVSALLVRALGLIDSTDVSPFRDIKGEWYSSPVATAYHAGLIKGNDNGNFRPNDGVTREELAVMLYRAALYTGSELKPGTAVTSANLNSVSPWANDAVRFSLQYGILTGDKLDELNPGGKATRAETAQMLLRMLTVVEFV
ncbi:S-layer homology domain-containing protein [Cohnella mopanensis]|uniref:S-layer homology domain-containing protein n=1 Tax=Cohnella mopanensis TaxID=2911966 RepID=UPI001EF970E1|nr:S-layer homology domain-containing protein [Cohnella mopanensis]